MVPMVMSPATPIPFSRYSGFDRHGISPIGAIAAAPMSYRVIAKLRHRKLSAIGLYTVLSLRHFRLARWCSLSLREAAPKARARRIKGNKAIADQPPLLNLSTKSHNSNERLRVSNWIVQRLNYYAVKKTIEFRLLTVFQHVADPARVCTVADKNLP